LDDFIFPRAALTNDCQKLMDTFSLVSKELGVTLAENKTKGPTITYIFLGLEIDTVLMKVKISEDKLNKLRLGIQYILEHKKMKFKELESIVGLMTFCAEGIHSFLAIIC
jgi:hypothetical protein